MEMKIVGVTIAVFVSLTVLAAVLIPVLDDATDTEDTFTNSGYYHMEKYGTDTDVTIVWDHTKPTKIAVNDAEYDLDTPVNQFVSVAFGDTWYVRYANGVTTFYVQMSYGGTGNLPASTANGTDITIVCSNGTATGTIYSSGVAGSTQSVSYTEIYAISGDTGDYVMKKSTDKAYMSSNSEFVGLGTTALGTNSAVCRISGSIEDGATVDVVASTATTTVTGDPEIHATALTNNIGYQLEKITFTLTVGGTDYPVTYSYFVVPAEVTLEKAEHLTEGQNQLLMVIPVLVIVAILLGVIALIVKSRLE